MKDKIKIGIKDEKEGIEFYKNFPEKDLTKEEKRKIAQTIKDEKKHLKMLEDIKHKEELGRLK